MRFDLDHLGWKSFQDLSLGIAEHVYALAVQSFSLGPDAGRDGAAAVLRGTSDAEGPAWGSIAIQCKHTSRPTRLTVAHVNPELPKIAALVKAGQCDTYMLFTNRPLSATVESAITKRIKGMGVTRVMVIGRETIERHLTDDKTLRGRIPRVYGLGDLSEILDERLYLQTRALLFDDDIAKFVPTAAYFKTIDALAANSFALLLGEPASGKSSILRLVAIHAADRWESAPLWITSLNEVRTHWNANRTDQLFLLDDAFGSTNFDPERAEQWNRSVDVMRAAINRGARFLLTSRTTCSPQLSEP